MKGQRVATARHRQQRGRHGGGWGRDVRPWVPGLVRLAAALLVLVCAVLAREEWQRLVPATVVLLVYGCAVALGELVRLDLPDLPGTAPVSTAVGLGLAYSLDVPTRDGFTVGAPVVVTVLGVALAVGAVCAGFAGRRGDGVRQAGRLLALAAGVWLYRAAPFSSGTLLELQAHEGPRSLAAVTMLLVTGLVTLADLVIAATLHACEHHAPIAATVEDWVRRGWLLLAALLASGALMALAETAIGLAALPVFVITMLITQVATRRYAEVRRTYLQTMQALSALPESTGFSRAGHAQRVAALAVEVGTELGVRRRDIVSLERAALLHDIGLVALADPVPDGRTVEATPGDQRIIASEGTRIAGSSGVLSREMEIVEAQATPFHVMRQGVEVIPLGGRILRVANAYDDHLVRATSDGHDRAMERLLLGLGYEYDPEVVEALARVVERRG